MQIKWIAVGLSLAMLILVVELVRRERLTFKYAAAWLLVSIAGVYFAVFHQFLFRVSQWFGFALPSNFIFFILFGVFVFLSLLMTVFLCQQNNRNDRMAQKIGLLEHEIRELKKSLTAQKNM